MKAAPTNDARSLQVGVAQLNLIKVYLQLFVSVVFRLLIKKSIAFIILQYLSSMIPLQIYCLPLKIILK